MNILGISAFYHDSAAALLINGEIMAAAQEERFTRKKNDSEFPVNSIDYCLKSNNLDINDIDYIVFYDKPLLKFERLINTYLNTAPKGFNTYIKSMPAWLRQKLWIPEIIKKNLNYQGKVLFTEHHQSHAGSAFYPSPFETAAILTVDGLGEWTTNSLGVGEGVDFKLFKDISFPHSIALLYSAFTYYTGFEVDSDEYKVMSLAPYGTPKYANIIYENLIDLKADGSYRLNMDYFDYLSGTNMTNDKFNNLFGGERRRADAALTQRDMDLASSIQAVVEETLLRQVKFLYAETECENLCLAGGLALNTVANGRLLKEGPFKNIFIQPAAGDAGGALGAALCTWHGFLRNKRAINQGKDSQKYSLLGPEYSDSQIQAVLDKLGATYTKFSDEFLFACIAEHLAEERVIGLFQGRMEFGTKALGNRSIIADARSASIQSKLNSKIKNRESFRSFSPIVMKEFVGEYFDLEIESPYMLLDVQLKEGLRLPLNQEGATKKGEWLSESTNINTPRSAVTHVDYSAGVQTVSAEQNDRLYSIMKVFYEKTDSPVLINTSFNIQGEPIVCTPEDAYTCFMRTEMDVLIVGNYILEKADQPKSIVRNELN